MCIRDSAQSVWLRGLWWGAGGLLRGEDRASRGDAVWKVQRMTARMLWYMLIYEPFFVVVFNKRHLKTFMTTAFFYLILPVQIWLNHNFLFIKLLALNKKGCFWQYFTRENEGIFIHNTCFKNLQSEVTITYYEQIIYETGLNWTIFINTTKLGSLIES